MISAGPDRLAKNNMATMSRENYYRSRRLGSAGRFSAPLLHAMTPRGVMACGHAASRACAARFRHIVTCTVRFGRSTDSVHYWRLLSMQSSSRATTKLEVMHNKRKHRKYRRAVVASRNAGRAIGIRWGDPWRTEVTIVSSARNGGRKQRCSSGPWTLCDTLLTVGTRAN